MTEENRRHSMDLELHDRVNNGDYDAVQELLSQGANVNHKDVIGDTPLIEAAWVGASEIVQLLLEHGADRTVIGSEGKTAFTLAWEIASEHPKSIGHKQAAHILASLTGEDA